MTSCIADNVLDYKSLSARYMGTSGIRNNASDAAMRDIRVCTKADTKN